MINKVFNYFFNKKIDSISTINQSKIYVFDIDNTLANTWPLLKNKNKLNWIEYLLIKPLNGSSVYFHKEIKNSPVLFLTTRHWIYYLPTYIWLFKNGFFNPGSKIILTSIADQKIDYLKRLRSKYMHEIYFYDDLAYGHETGTIKFYSEVISKIEQMNIKYHDFYFIQNMNLDA